VRELAEAHPLFSWQPTPAQGVRAG
jgi:hypothetical protein